MITNLSRQIRQTILTMRRFIIGGMFIREEDMGRVRHNRLGSTVTLAFLLGTVLLVSLTYLSLSAQAAGSTGKGGSLAGADIQRATGMPAISAQSAGEQPIAAKPQPPAQPVSAPLAPGAVCSTFPNYQVLTNVSALPVPGTTDIGNHCDDCMTAIVLPFPVTFYDQVFTSVNASSNGNLQFGSSNAAYSNFALPSAGFNFAILPFWDDLQTSDIAGGQGIFTSVSGTAPNRIFNINWFANFLGSPGVALNFEVRLYENQARLDLAYGNGTGAYTTGTIGVQRDTGSLYHQYNYDGTGGTISVGTQIKYVLPTCTTCSNGDYTTVTSNGPIVPGTTRIDGTGCDDCTYPLALPFAYSLYDLSFSSVNVSTNGNLQFASSTTQWTNSCLPSGIMSYAILPYWDDLITIDAAACPGGACGIYTSVSGTAPNRIVNIEWRARDLATGTTYINFEVRLFEGTTYFEMIYATTASDGNSATSGVQMSTGTRSTQYSCNTAALNNGMRVAYTLICPAAATPTATITSTSTATSTPLATATATTAPCGPPAWTQQAVYPVANIEVPAVAALGGFVYSFGGMVSGLGPTTAAYRYSTAANTWTAIAALPQGRDGASAVTDGTYLYILNGSAPGGSLVNTLLRYDPVANTYLTMAASPRVSRQQAAAFLSGKIYRVGGCSPTCTSFTASVDVYTVATNTWGTVASYPLALVDIALVTDGVYLYSAGGNTVGSGDTNRTFRYDPAANLWDDAAITNMPSVRSSAGFGVLNGRFFLAGGYVAQQTDGSVIALDLSNPTGAWASLTAMPVPVSYMGSAVSGSAFYAVDGRTTAGPDTTATQRYYDAPCIPTVTSTATGTATSTSTNTVTNTATSTVTNTVTRTPTITPTCGPGAWTQQAVYPVANIEMPAVAALGGFVYSFGGSVSGSGPTTAAYRHDTAANTWTAIASLPEGREFASAVTDGTYLYILNGIAPGGLLRNTLLRYDPIANTYLTMAASPRVSAQQAAAYLGGKIYRVGGCSPTCGSITTSVDVYTVATNTWAASGTVADYSLAVTSMALVAQGSYLYGAGGSYAASNTDKTYRYDPAANSWSDAAITDLPTRRSQPGFGVLNGRFFLAGGSDPVVASGSAIALDLSDPIGAWASLAIMPVPVRDAGSTVSGSAFYGIGGITDSAQVNATQRYSEAPCAPTVTPVATHTATATAAVTSTATTTPTNTSVPTITGTSTSTSTPAVALLVGHVTWQGIAQPNSHNTGITATLSLCVGGVAQNYGVATDASGFFTVTTGLPNGTYNWQLKGVLNLANSGALSLVGASTQVEMGLQTAGDSTNDNVVGATDFNVLKNTFGKGVGQPGYDARGDFNRDTTVTSLDFNLLKGNFGQSGSVLTCP